LWQITHPETIGNPLCEVCFNMAQVTDHGFPDMRMLDLRQLKDQRGGKMRLFEGVLAAIELPCLAVMIGKALCPNPAFCAGLAYRRAVKASHRAYSD
jgi:hypothetical protein